MVLMSKPLPLPMLGMPLLPIKLVMALRSCFSSRPAQASAYIHHVILGVTLVCRALAGLHCMQMRWACGIQVADWKRRQPID